MFVQLNCPVKECFLTSDTEKKKLTADALLISQIGSHSVKTYLPKPAHQIWIARHMVRIIYVLSVSNIGKND
jgi:hypothetical protein